MQDARIFSERRIGSVRPGLGEGVGHGMNERKRLRRDEPVPTSEYIFLDCRGSVNTTGAITAPEDRSGY
jgi:hypothetical protein